MDEYVVRLAHRPPLTPGSIRPRRGMRRVPMRFALVIAIGVVALAYRSSIGGWLEGLRDGAEGSVHAVQAEQQIQNAGNILERQWSRDGTYDVPTSRLSELGGEVTWSEVVDYEVCFDGIGAVATATTVSGERSVLAIRGFDYGIVSGAPGCPASPVDRAPWEGAGR